MNVTSRTFSTDPQLNALAANLENIQFDFSPDDRELFAEREQQESLQNVSKFRDGRTYRVRFFLGGRQRVIGITKDGPVAALFADCARIYFWPYRLRQASPPDASDFNFDEETARATLEHHESLGTYLDKIREHLASFGDLRERSVEEDNAVSERRSLKEKRFTLRSLLDQVIREKDAEIVTTRAALGDLTEVLKFQHGELKTVFRLICDRLTALEEAAKQKDA